MCRAEMGDIHGKSKETSDQMQEILKKIKDNPDSNLIHDIHDTLVNKREPVGSQTAASPVHLISACKSTTNWNKHEHQQDRIAEVNRKRAAFNTLHPLPAATTVRRSSSSPAQNFQANACFISPVDWNLTQPRSSGGSPFPPVLAGKTWLSEFGSVINTWNNR